MAQTEKQLISCEKINQSYYKIRHKSGLTLLLCPMNEYNSVYALFGTKFGSMNRTFKTSKDAEYTTVPDGIAHFLEHKLFEGEEEDAFVNYSRTGANANAYTSFDRTCYLFSATEKVYESLEILLNFVTHPYFTKETVEKELGIIGQEIKMYDDNPGWCVFLNLLKCLYWENPIRIDIAGSVESIAQITPELLYKTYNTFYNLNNMVLSVAGNFDIDKVIELCDKVLKKAEDVKIENLIPNEPEDIFLKNNEKQLDVSIPYFEIGFKEKPDLNDFCKNQLISEIILEMLFGESSEFYKRLYDSGLINASFGTEVMAGEGYFINIIGGESNEPQKVYDEIVKEIKSAKQSGLERERFEEIKKLVYGRSVFDFNSVTSIATSMMSAEFKGASLFENLYLAQSITFEDIEKRLNEQFFEEKSSISIISPINN